MIDKKEMDIVTIEDRLNLNFIDKHDFSRDDCDDIIDILKSKGNNKLFRKIEIDFGKTLFEITDLLEILIKNSFLFKNRQTQVVLNLGKLDLENRIKYLRSFNQLNINNYKINYFKK